MTNDPQQSPAGSAFDRSSGLEIETATDAQSPVVDLFFQHYNTAFVLPQEKEGLEGFRKCLALNAGHDYEWLSERYGPFREFVLAARDRASGEIVGGANFVAFLLPTDPPIVTINLNYIFVAPAWRRLGYFRILLGTVQQYGTRALVGEARAFGQLIFIEQNDPLRMSDEAYECDTAHAGLDQSQRILIWAKLGARLIDFPYIQPPLSPAQAPDNTLSYAVLGTREDHLGACLLREHLVRFFAISVLKGEEPENDPTAVAQLTSLFQACAEARTIPLLGLSQLSSQALATFRATPFEKRPHSLRDALRNLAKDGA